MARRFLTPLRFPAATPAVQGDAALDAFGRLGWHNGAGVVGAATTTELVTDSLNLTPFATGQLVVPTGITAYGTRAMAAGDSGSVWYYRWDQPYFAGISLASLLMAVTGAQSGGSATFRLGIYADEGFGRYPALSSSPLVDVSTTALTSTGDKAAAISGNFAASRGTRWLAIGYYESSAPTTRATVRMATGTFLPLPRTTTATMVAPSIAYKQVAGSSAALPTTPAAASSYDLTATQPPAIFGAAA